MRYFRKQVDNSGRKKGGNKHPKFPKWLLLHLRHTLQSFFVNKKLAKWGKHYYFFSFQISLLFFAEIQYFDWFLIFYYPKFCQLLIYSARLIFSTVRTSFVGKSNNWPKIITVATGECFLLKIHLWLVHAKAALSPHYKSLKRTFTDTRVWEPAL